MLPIPIAYFEFSTKVCNSGATTSLSPSVWYKLDAGTASTDTNNLNTYGTYSIPSLPELGVLVGYKRLYDFTGNSRHLLQSSSDNSTRITPQFATQSLQNTLIYSVPRDNNTNFNNTNMAYTVANNGTFVLVWRNRGGGRKSISFRSDSTNTAGFQLLQKSGSDTFYFTFFNDTVSTQFTPTSDFMIFIHSKNSSNTVLYSKVNDVNTSAAATKEVDVGPTGVPSSFGWTLTDSDVAEFMFFNTAISANDCESLYSYLSQKWCI
jgi:hypothetical protein